MIQRIHLPPHAVMRAAKRGVTLEEITEVVQLGSPVEADFGRFARVMVFPFRQEWRGIYHDQKKARVIFAVEGDLAVVVTVISYCGTWRDAS
jgi:hypothetical protein